MAAKLDISYPEPGVIGHVKLNDESIQCTRVAVDFKAGNFPQATIFMNSFPANVQVADAKIIMVIGDKSYRLVEVKDVLDSPQS